MLRHGNDAQDTEYGYDAASRISGTTVTLKDVQGRAVYATTLHTDYNVLGQAATKALADGQVLRMKRQQSGVVRNSSLQSAARAQLHERLGDWLPSGVAQTVQAWMPRQAIASDGVHHPYNGITGFTLGNGLRTDKRFDAAGRVTALRDGVEQTIYGYGVGPRITKLDRAAIFRGYPSAVRTDNGPEFTSRAFMAWAQAHGVRHILIEPGRPMQNGYIESFNGKFRDECLNDNWFQTLYQARTTIGAWRQDYNQLRPHSSSGRMPPARFAELHRRRAGDAAQQPANNDESS